MKTLILFDSYFGNTQIIAETIAKEFENCDVLKVIGFDNEKLKGIDLLILGSPIRGWQPTEGTMAFLNSLSATELSGVKATAFDTRVKLFIHGDAKNKMAKDLEKAGAKIIVEPKAFYVTGQEGPLFEGELQEATKWAQQIRANFK